MWPFKKKSKVKQVEQEIKYRIVPGLVELPKKARDVTITFLSSPEVFNTTIYGDYDTSDNLEYVDLRTGEVTNWHNISDRKYHSYRRKGKVYILDPELESVNGEYRFVVNGSEYRYPLSSIKRVSLGPVYTSTHMVEVAKDTLELIEKEEK